MTKLLSFLVITTLLLAGCASSGLVVSTEKEAGASDKPSVGLIYMLPKRYMQLTVQRKPIETNLDKKITAAKAGRDKAKAAAATAETAMKAAKKLYDDYLKKPISEQDAGVREQLRVDAKIAALKYTPLKAASETTETKYQKLVSQRAGYNATSNELFVAWEVRNSARAIVMLAKAKHQSQKDECDELISKKTPDQQAIKECKNALLTLKEELNLKKAVFDRAEIDLQKMRNDLRQKSTHADAKARFTYDIKLELLPAVGDPSSVFVADLKHKMARDDDLTLTTTPEGLLSSANITSTDRTADILIDLASLAAVFFGGVPPPPATGGMMSLQETPTIKPACALDNKLKLNIKFDPTDNVDYVNSTLMTCEVPFTLAIGPPEAGSKYFDLMSQQADLIDQENKRKAELKALKEDPAANTPAVKQLIVTMENRIEDVKRLIQLNVIEANNLYKAGFSFGHVLMSKYDDDTAPGLFYRRPVPYLVMLINNVGGQVILEDSTIVLLPNKGPIGLIPFNAEGFVKTVLETKFKDGQPTEWHQNKPSEIKAAVRIPLDIIRAVFSVVTEVIQLKVNLNNAEAALLTSEVAKQKADFELTSVALAQQTQQVKNEMAMLEAKGALELETATQALKNELAQLEAKGALELEQTTQPLKNELARLEAEAARNQEVFTRALNLEKEILDLKLAIYKVEQELKDAKDLEGDEITVLQEKLTRLKLELDIKETEQKLGNS